MDEAPLKAALPDRLLAVSPHLDDAVFSCGSLLAASSDPLVVTVFAGAPPAGLALTEWDRACGFASGEEAIGERHVEDRTALAIVGARAAWLDFRDRQYLADENGPGAVADIADALLGAIARYQARTLLLPLALFHSDHRLAREAALLAWSKAAARKNASPPVAIVYADALYRALPGLTEAALGEISAAGFAATQVGFADSESARERKLRAVAAYRSQLRALLSPGKPGLDDLAQPERYWRLEFTGESDAA